MKNIQTTLLISLILNLILLAIIAIAVIRYRTEIIKKLTENKTYTIVMFGNSLTAHGNWSSELKRGDVRNAGFPGFTTFNYLHVIDKSVIRHKPKLCFIEGGINDLGVSVPIECIEKNYSILVEKLQNHKVEPVLQSVLYVNYPWEITNQTTNAQVDTLNNFLRTLAKEKNLTYIDLNAQLSENGKLKSEYHTDGIHLNKKAYKIWASAVNKVLKEKGY